MGVIFQSGYVLPGGNQSLKNARILHSLNWLTGGNVVADDGSSILLEQSGYMQLEDATHILLENVNSTDFGYFADGPLISLTYEKWKPGSVPATWEYNHSAPASCDTVCVGAHTLGTNGNTLQIQYWNGAAWINLIPPTVITNDMAIMVIFVPVTAQRWRLLVTGGTPPSIGVIKFGLAMQVPQAVYGGHKPIEFARQTTMRTNESETGEFLGRTKQRVALVSSLSFTHLTDAWIRSNWKDFQLAIEQEPFFVAWRPGTHSEVVLCRTEVTPEPSNMGIKDMMSVELGVRAYASD